MNLRIFESTKDLIASAARTIEQRLSGRDSAAIAISGGSTPKPLYEMLAASPHRETLAKIAITWVVVDERFVPITDPQSNAAMIQRTLFGEGMSPSHRFLSFRTDVETPARSATEFEERWRSLGLGNLDIILLGMGDDGHTASLFPDTPVLGVQDRIAADVFVPRLNQSRVTLTLPVIRAAKLRIVLAAGESKAPILREVRDGVAYPIALATGGEIETWWFIDRAAAAEVAEPRNTQ
jgi:6-phosphogluconolactonase